MSVGAGGSAGTSYYRILFSSRQFFWNLARLLWPSVIDSRKGTFGNSLHKISGLANEFQVRCS